MKKLGFTLAEILVTLTIIGIVAALAAPLLNDLMPDKNKMRVLRYNTLINNATQKVMNNEEYYPPYEYKMESDGSYALDNNGNLIAPGVGLEDDLWPIGTTLEDDCKLISTDKYTCLMAKEIGLVPNSELTNYTFTDGSVWTFTNPSLGYYIINVNITGNAATGCVYDQCTNPKSAKQFEFSVDRYGVVEGNDSLTKAYLKNPLKVSDRKNDLAEAANIKNNTPSSNDSSSNN